ncbi:MAG TPA: GerMN domain-containing protein [Nitrospirota bacterium]
MSQRVKNEDGGRLWPWVVAAFVLAAALSTGAYLFFKDSSGQKRQVAAAFQPVTSFTGPRVARSLYFPAADGKYLRAERRDVRDSADKAQQVRAVVEELVRGPLSEGLTPSFPAASRVKSVFISPDGTAYINFSREIQHEFPGGAWTETLTIYSLTNTLAEAFPDIRQVQIMVEGTAIDTLAGHIDTTRPFRPRPALNKE